MHVESNMADEESGKKPQKAALYAFSFRRVFSLLLAIFLELPITRTPDNWNFCSIFLEGSSYRESTVAACLHSGQGLITRLKVQFIQEICSDMPSFVTVHIYFKIPGKIY